MTKLLIAFMGNKRDGGIHLDNIMVTSDANAELSFNNISEIKDCIAFRFGLESVVILNVMRLGTDDAYLVVGNDRR